MNWRDLQSIGPGTTAWPTRKRPTPLLRARARSVGLRLVASSSALVCSCGREARLGVRTIPDRPNSLLKVGFYSNCGQNRSCLACAVTNENNRIISVAVKSAQRAQMGAWLEWQRLYLRNPWRHLQTG